MYRGNRVWGGGVTGKANAAVIVLHHAVLAANVARQPRVGRRVDVARDDFVGGLLARCCRHLGASGGGGPDRDWHHVRRQGGHHCPPFLASSAMRCASSAWVTTPFLSSRSSVAWSQCS